MPNYSIYYMNPVSGHIDRTVHLHVGDDVAAVHALQKMREDVPLELWRDGKKVARQDGPANAIRERLLSAAAPGRDD